VEEKTVATPSAEVTVMREPHAMLEALMGGTRKMRKVSSLLPKWSGEDADAYKDRLAAATLFPAYKRTVNVMSSKPFAEPLTLQDAPPDIEKWAEDIDREGVNLHTFAQDCFRESFYGLAGILVESPKALPIKGRAPTKAEQDAAGVRPYMVRIKHDQLIGWRISSGNGGRKLMQLRYQDDAVVDDGEFGTKLVKRVRVLEPGKFRVYELRKTEVTGKEEWVLIEEGLTDLPEITFVPVYGFRDDFMCGSPPLEDLAYNNVKHWQSQSDQDNILHCARVPILKFKTDDEKAELKIGAAQAVRIPQSADLEWVELQGNSIGEGGKSLDALEKQMIQDGAELLVKQPGTRTATESENDADANRCYLQRMAEGFKDALEQAIRYMAMYAKLPDTTQVKLFMDFGVDRRTMDAILKMFEDGLISEETVWEAAIERGELPENFDADVEKERLASASLGPAPKPTAPVGNA